MSDRRQDAATAGVSGGLIVAGAYGSRRASAPARAARGARPWYDPPARSLITHGTKGARRGYLLASAAQGIGVTGLSQSINNERHRLKKQDSLLVEGLRGTAGATKEKIETTRHKTPLHARAAMLAGSAAAGGLGSLAAHRVVDRVAPASKLRPAATALTGAAAIAGSLPVTSRLANRGYTKTPAGVKRQAKLPVRPTRRAMPMIDARTPSMRTRQQLVPSDQVFKAEPPSRTRHRALIAGAGGIPVVGDFAAARVASRLAPEGQKRQAAATQFAGNAGGSLAGTVGGAYAGAALSRRPGFAAGAQRVDDALNRGKARIPGYSRAAGAFGRFKPAGAGEGRAGAAWRAATKPLGGRAKAGAAVGSLAGATVLGQTGSFRATTINLDRAERRRTDLAKALGAVALPTGQDLAQERQLLQRKRKNTRIATANAALGTAGVGLLVASRGRFKPSTKASLERAALGTAVAGGGLGAAGGFQSASIARRDIRTRERQLGIAKAAGFPGVRLPSYRASGIATYRRGGRLIPVRRRAGVAR